MNRLADVEKQIGRIDESHHSKLAEIHAELDKKVDTEYFDSEILKLTNANENRTKDICKRISNVGVSVPQHINNVDKKIDAKVDELRDENRNLLSTIARLNQASSSPDASKNIGTMVEKQLSSLCKPIISNAEKNRKATLDHLDSLEKRLATNITEVKESVLQSRKFGTDCHQATLKKLDTKFEETAKSSRTTQKISGEILLRCQKLDDIPTKSDEPERVLKELAETTQNHMTKLMTNGVRKIISSNKELIEGRPLEVKKEPEKPAEKPKPDVDFTKLAESIKSHTESCCDTLTKEIRNRSTETNESLRRRTDAIQANTKTMQTSMTQISQKCQQM